VTDAERDEPDIYAERRGNVMWIILNRPAVRNAMTRAMGGRLGELLSDAAADDAVGAVVVSGSGSAFSAGLDRKEIAKGLEGKSEFPVEQMVAFTKPTIAAINGLAYGGGATMAMACDLRIAADDATITFGLGKVGLVPEWGSSYLLWRQIGYSRALEVMLTARTIGAAEALTMGLVNRVVPRDALDTAVTELAEQITALPPGTATAIKEVLRNGLDGTFEEARITETRMLGRRSRALAEMRRTASAG
jgi:2-(1,2-epoxy-1,2-dihydrophenyl)acetyl-CoA isomerase